MGVRSASLPSIREFGACTVHPRLSSRSVTVALPSAMRSLRLSCDQRSVMFPCALTNSHLFTVRPRVAAVSSTDLHHSSSADGARRRVGPSTTAAGVGEGSAAGPTTGPRRFRRDASRRNLPTDNNAVGRLGSDAAQRNLLVMATTERESIEQEAESRDPRVAHPIFTLREAAGYLGVPKSTIHQWARPPAPSRSSPSFRGMVASDGPFIGFAEAYVLSAFRQSGCSAAADPTGGRRPVSRDRYRTRTCVTASVHRRRRGALRLCARQ